MGVKHSLALATAIVCSGQILSANAIQLGEDYTLTVTPGIVSDYRTFGFSWTRGNPAIQLDASLMHSSGALVGIWASNVDYDTSTRLEEGYFAGYYHQFAEGIDIYATLGRYEYPKDAHFDTNEAVGIVNYHQFRYGILYDFDVRDTPNAKYQWIGYTVALPYDVGLYFQYGYDDVNLDLYSSNGSARQTYHDWKIEASKRLLGLDWSVAYVDSDLSESECASYAGDKEGCSSTLIFGVKKTF